MTNETKQTAVDSSVHTSTGEGHKIKCKLQEKEKENA